MNKISKAPPTLLSPRGRKDDEVRVYRSSFFDKNSHVEYSHQGHRIIHVDPEVIHRLASVGMSREMIAGYYGMNKAKFAQMCEEYPEVDEAFLMGFSQGIAKTAMALEKQIENGNMVSTIFRLKTGGFIEADKRKDVSEDNAPRVQVYLPSNGRDIIQDEYTDDE